MCLLPFPDACRPVLGSDALLNRRTLFEPGELGRPPQSCVRPILMCPDGASLVLATFAETKVARLPGRDPATQKFTLTRKLEPPVRYALITTRFSSSDSNEFSKSSVSMCLLPFPDACRPVLGSDALLNRRALFEPGELDRPPQVCVPPL